MKNKIIELSLGFKHFFKDFFFTDFQREREEGSERKRNTET